MLIIKAAKQNWQPYAIQRRDFETQFNIEYRIEVSEV